MPGRMPLFCWLLIFLLLTACNWQSGPKHVLVFQATATAGSEKVDLARAVEVVKRRLYGGGLKCRFRVETAGVDNLQVTTHGATPDELAGIEEMLTVQGSLEFAPIASPGVNEELVAAAKDADREVTIRGIVRGAWFPESAEATSRGERYVSPFDKGTIRERTVDGKARWERLVVYEDGLRITGELLQEAHPSVDSSDQPCIAFTLTPEGGDLMFILTNELKPESAGRTRQLGIIWNDELQSAPTIQSAIRDRGIITGKFSEREIQLQVALLSSGQLPCKLTLVKQTSED